MSRKINILIVDDDEVMADVLRDILCAEGYSVQIAGNGSEALTYIHEQSVDIVLLDLLLPGMDGIEILKRILEADKSIVVVMMSGHGTIKNAVQATKLGAYEWMEKPLEKERVLLTIRNAVERHMLQQERDVLLAEARETYKMVGVSDEMQQVYQLIDKVAPTDVTVLITGESGTGKELVAHAIHNNSTRSACPFIEINCAAVPDTLIESELFGHTKGSFTGAIKDHQGKFQLAHNGTFFMDEIGDLSFTAQAKVLRAIESGEVEKVGSMFVEKVDVRFISATNMDLSKHIQQGSFREDLFHRINVVEINIPPLRQRKDDILLLLYHFLEHFASKYNILNKELNAGAEVLVMTYDWPGNVRQLRNFAEKVMVLIDDRVINKRDAAELLEFPQIGFDGDAVTGFSEAKRNFEKQFLINALRQNNWNVSQTADAIAMHRSLLYRKINKYGITKGPVKPGR